ncbi:hypothetical protein [Sanyastnella coralliicola]|uniref:hypothetical protein n=1 Tax=Sanyastnella coralliicola TaxID=3069118 RepID=UPI0027BAEB8D|nr:hypothetical protein [Longitalea sp. SCSIO 12813]
MKNTTLDQFLIDDTQKVKVSELLWGKSKSVVGVVMFVIVTLLFTLILHLAIVVVIFLLVLWIIGAYMGFSRQVYEIDIENRTVRDYVKVFGLYNSKGEVIYFDDYPYLSMMRANVVSSRQISMISAAGVAGNDLNFTEYRVTLLSKDHRRKHVIERIIEDPEKAKKRVEAWSEKLDLPVVTYSPPRVARRRR